MKQWWQRHQKWMKVVGGIMFILSSVIDFFKDLFGDE